MCEKIITPPFHFDHLPTQVPKSHRIQNLLDIKIKVSFESQNMKVFLQILNPVNNAEILAPELMGGQSEMVV